MFSKEVSKQKHFNLLSIDITGFYGNMTAIRHAAPGMRWDEPSIRVYDYGTVDSVVQQLELEVSHQLVASASLPSDESTPHGMPFPLAPPQMGPHEAVAAGGERRGLVRPTNARAKTIAIAALLCSQLVLATLFILGGSDA